MNAPIAPDLRQRVIDRLTAHGITPTRQRVEIGLCLFDADKHVTADQLLEQVNRQASGVSKATVYNTLGLFAAKGLLREVVIDANKLVYDTNTTRHHHLYDVESGELRDLPGEALRIEGLAELEDELAVESVDLVVRVRARR